MTTPPDLLISTTAVQRGFGRTRFKYVRFLTAIERAFIRDGGIVAFRSAGISGGNHGTYWRIAVPYRKYDFVPRVPDKELTNYLETNHDPWKNPCLNSY